MRLTRTGSLVAVFGTVLIVVGRILGLTELFAIGAAIALLVATCGGWVAFRSLNIVVSRRLRPVRVHVGNPCVVEVAVTNRATRPSPVLRLLDPVSHTAGADLLLPPIDVRETEQVSYRLPTPMRGSITVGPMHVEVTDPFGLATARTRTSPRAEITVLPRVDDIPALPRSVGPDPDGSTETGSLGRSGEDFAALRPYVIGDDMRRVHWPSTARTGELLIRQHDVPWQGRICVVLDVRRQSDGGDAFEAAVSACASILRTHLRRGDHARLVTTAGLDTGYGVGSSHLDVLLDRLAVVERTSSGSMHAAIDVIDRGASGAVVFVSSRPTDADIEVVERSGAAVSLRRVVRFDGALDMVTARGTHVLGVVPGAFKEAWTAATAATGRRRATRVGRIAARPGNGRR